MPDSAVTGTSSWGEPSHGADKHTTSGSPSIQRRCTECAEEEGLIQRQNMEDEEEGALQTKRAASATPDIAPGIEARIYSLRGRGQPLRPTERAFFEPPFGRDFSQVRINTNAQAAESARAVHARAFTVGRDVVFGAGEYTPETAARQRLLAHELNPCRAAVTLGWVLPISDPVHSRQPVWGKCFPSHPV